MTSRLRRPAGALLAGALTVGILGITPLAQAAVSGPGTISGTVTDSHGAMEGVSVEAYVLVDGAWTWSDYSAVTDADGAYILDVPADTYRLGFNDYDDHVEEFWDDAATVQAADDIVITDSTSASADAVLAELGHVTGTVTGADDKGLAGIDIWASQKLADGWDFVANATTDANGNYSLDGLEPGSYRVEFEGGTDDAPLYEAYNNKGRFDDGDDIPVALDTTVRDIDAKLIAGEFDTKYLDRITQPTLTGTPQVGSTLTATAGTYSPTPSSIRIQWLRGRDSGLEAIEGATSWTYTLTAADAGAYISFVTFASLDGYEEDSNGPEYVGPVTAAPVVTAPPVVTPPVVAPPAPAPTEPTITFPKSMDVTGALKVGSTLKLKNYKALVSRSTVSYTFQWYAGSKKIKKATKSKLKVTRSLKGTKISVKVTARTGTTKKTVKVKVGKIR